MTEQDLFDAIRKQDMTAVKQTLQSGISPNCFMEKEPFWTPLIDAIDELDNDGPIQLVQMLINAGANVNCWDKTGESHPLIKAMIGEHQEAIRLLFEAGVDPDITDSEGTTPIRIAVEREDRELLEFILSAGAPVTMHTSDPATGRNALGMAVNQQNWEMAKRLLAAGADPHLLDIDYRTAVDYIPKDLPDAVRMQWLELLR